MFQPPSSEECWSYIEREQGRGLRRARGQFRSNEREHREQEYELKCLATRLDRRQILTPNILLGLREYSSVKDSSTDCWLMNIL